MGEEGEEEEVPPTPWEQTVSFFAKPTGRFLLCTLLLALASFGYPFLGVCIMDSLNKWPHTVVFTRHKTDLFVSNLVGFCIALAFFLVGFVIALIRYGDTGLGQESVDVLITAIPFTLAAGFSAPAIGLMAHPHNLAPSLTVEALTVATAIGMSIIVGAPFVLLVISSCLFQRFVGN